MKRLPFCMVLVCVVVTVVSLVGSIVYAQINAIQNVPRMTKEDLKKLMGDPDLVVIDVRAQGDWDRDTLMIKGAVREDPTKVPSWIDQYPKEKTLVFYCA